MTGLLTNKTAIIYGGGGGLGSAVARAFGRDGAKVILVGRTRATLDAAATAVTDAGGYASVAVLDAADETAVDEHVRQVVAETGSVDISLNLISRGDVQGIPLVEMTTEQMLRAIDTGLGSNFVTARAAARQMTTQGSGVILHLNSASGDGAMPGMGSTGPTDAAIESFMRYLAAEVGPSGVRVCGIWTAGVAETLTDEKIAAVAPGGPTAEQALQAIAGMAALRRTPRVADVAEVAAFLASDRAAGMTGSMANVTCGLVLR